MRILTRYSPPRPPGSYACQAAGCEVVTREHKPFCPAHLTRHAYVQDLLRTLANSEDEVAAVRRLGALRVDCEGLVAREILRELTQEGPRSMRRLARDLNLELKVLRHYLQALEGAGRIVLRRGKRGVVRVSRQLTWRAGVKRVAS